MIQVRQARGGATTRIAIIVLNLKSDQGRKDSPAMRTITRVAELERVFRSGQSDLLNTIARLSILYEGLRLEMREGITGLWAKWFNPAIRSSPLR